MGPPARRQKRKERSQPEEDPPEVAKSLWKSAAPQGEYYWDSILRNLSLDERRADPQGVGRPWVRGSPIVPTLARDIYSNLPLMSEWARRRYLDPPPSAGPPTMRRCIECFAYRLPVRPFAEEICLACIQHRLIVAKWTNICAKMWGRRNTGFWEQAVSRKYMAKGSLNDSQEE